MLVVPILSRRNELLGCCQLINKGQEGDVFTQSDINFTQVFCSQASLGIENSFENLRLKKHLLYPKSKAQADEELHSTLDVAHSSTNAERILIWQVDSVNSITFPFKNVLERFDTNCVFDLKDKVCVLAFARVLFIVLPLLSPSAGPTHMLRQHWKPHLPALCH